MIEKQTQKTGAAVHFDNRASRMGAGTPDTFFKHGVEGERMDFVTNLFSAIQAKDVLGRDILRIESFFDYDQDYAGDMQGLYKATFHGGEPREVLLRVKPNIDEDTYDRANRVFSHLAEKGLGVPDFIPVSDDSVVGAFGGYQFAVTRFEPDLLDPSPYLYTDMRGLGMALSVLENGMKTLPEDLKADIYDGAGAIDAVGQAGYESILSTGGVGLVDKAGASLGAASLDKLCAVAEEIQNDGFDLVPVHGDLVLGNLMVKENGQAVILDPDNIGSFVRPDMADFGMAAYRIALGNMPDASDEQKLQALDWIIEGYNETSERQLTREDACDAMEIALAYKVFSNVGGIIMKGDNPYDSDDPKNGGIHFHSGVFRDFLQFSDYALKAPAPSVDAKDDYTF